MLYLLYLPVLTALILLYFKFAVQFKIIDNPNHRSSHSRITIRGAGIIFPIAISLQALFSGFQYPLFTSGLLLISIFPTIYAGGFDGLSSRDYSSCLYPGYWYNKCL